MGHQQEAWKCQIPLARFVLPELFCVLWVGDSFYSMTLSASQWQLQIFLGSGNPLLTCLFRHRDDNALLMFLAWEYSTIPTVSLNPAYTFEDGSFINSSWIPYLSVLFFDRTLPIILMYVQNMSFLFYI